jgi:tetratricopeptide (TPR) repeat protein
LNGPEKRTEPGEPENAISMPMAPPATPTIELPAATASATAEQLQAEAEGVAEDLQARFPESPEALHVAAMLFADLRQTSKAEKIWRKCLELNTEQVGPYIGLATVDMGLGNDEQAVETLQNALAIGLSAPKVYHDLATALTKLGRSEEAEKALQKGVASFPRDAENWLLLGQTQIRLGHFEEAETSLQKAVALGFESSRVYYSLANACTRQGKHEEAAEYRKRFSELKASEPSSEGRWSEEVYPAMLRRLAVSVLRNAGEVYFKQEEHTEAERHLLRAIALEPADSSVYSLLAGLYYELGRLADAQVVQRRVVEIDPQNLLNHINLATISAELGDYATAEDSLKQVIDAKPDAAVAHAGLAELYLLIGELEQARLFAEEAVRWEKTVPGYILLAQVCQRLGDSVGVGAALEKARELMPRTLPVKPSARPTVDR